VTAAPPGPPAESGPVSVAEPEAAAAGPDSREQTALTSLLTTSPLITDPAFLLLAVGTAIRSGFARELARWQLRPLQYQILVILSCAGRVRQFELCQALGITTAHLAGLIDGLRAMNCVTRTREGSRRRYVLSISARGIDVLAGAQEAADEYARGFLVPLTSRERHELAGALRTLYVTSVPESAARASHIGPWDRQSPV